MNNFFNNEIKKNYDVNYKITQKKNHRPTLKSRNKVRYKKCFFYPFSEKNNQASKISQGHRLSKTFKYRDIHW